MQHPPTYTIDLDVDPKDRWKDVTQDYCHLWPLLVEKFDEFEYSFANALETHLRELGGRDEWMEEMRGIAEQSNECITFESLVCLNLSYELMEDCGCTSIVSKRNNTVYLARTLDWTWTDILKALTIQVEFVRGGRKLFTSTSIAGYCGVLTAVRKGLCVSVNYRQDDDCDHTNHAWPIGFLVRHVMTLSNVDYDRAKNIFSYAYLWSPCYVILAGGGGKGCIITRGQKTVDAYQDLSSSTHNVLIQTNIDNERVCDKSYPDFMQSRGRYNDVKEYLETTSKGSRSDMWNVLMLKTVWDLDTVFGTVMNPDTNQMETRYEAPSKDSSNVSDFRVAILILALVILFSKVYIY
eukprot:g5022.t1